MYKMLIRAVFLSALFLCGKPDVLQASAQSGYCYDTDGGPGGCMQCFWTFDLAEGCQFCWVPDCTWSESEQCPCYGSGSSKAQLRRRLNFDHEMIRLVAKQDPNFAVTLWNMRLRDFAEGEEKVLKWAPVDITSDDIEYFLNPNTDVARAFLASYKERARQVLAIQYATKTRADRADIRLVGRELQVRIYEQSTILRSQIVIPLKDSNFIR